MQQLISDYIIYIFVKNSKMYYTQVFNGDEISNMTPSRICFVMIGIVTLLAHTFLYCGAGEIMAKQVRFCNLYMNNILEFNKLDFSIRYFNMFCNTMQHF